TELAEPVVDLAEAPALAVSEPSQVETAVAAAPEQPTDVAAKVEPAPEEMIEVWRPGRREDHARRPRPERTSQRPPRQRRPHRSEAPTPAATAAGEAPPPAPRQPAPAPGGGGRRGARASGGGCARAGRASRPAPPRPRSRRAG